MNDKTHNEVEPPTGVASSVDVPVGPTASPTRVASRRYMLLKGIGRGAAILAAATPIKTLASVPSVTADGQICTVSGTQSGVHSHTKNLPTCAGLSPGYYTKPEHWPHAVDSNGNPTYTYGGKTFNRDSKFGDVFGYSGQSYDNSSLIYILQNMENTAASHWIAALLNAIMGNPSGYVFPYSPEEVLNLYNSPQQAAALAFFKGYMETHGH